MPDAIDILRYPPRLDDVDDSDWNIEPGPAAAPPFAPGQKVVFARQPHFGAMTVTRVTPHPSGSGWSVYYTAPHGVEGCCPDFRMKLAPEGWDDPPAIPFGSLPPGSSWEAWEQKREIDAADHAHQEAFRDWQAAMERWLQRFGQ